MKRILLAIAGVLAVTGALLLAQAGGTPPSQPPDTGSAGDLTLTGCLIPGAEPSTYLLDNAKADPKSSMEKAKTYFVVEAAEGLTLAGQVNHVVRITGTAEQKPQAVAPLGGKVSDKDWPKLRAKVVTFVANVCTNGRP